MAIFSELGKVTWYVDYHNSTDNAFNGRDYVHLLLKLVLVGFDP